MSIEQLPDDPKKWRVYFDKTFGYINDILPKLSFGLHKIKLIVENLKDFRKSYEQRISFLNYTKKKVIYSFFNTCYQFIVLCSEYKEDNFINFFLKHYINQQYEDLFILWNSWSNQSSSLLFDCFINDTELCHANDLDIKDILNTIKPLLDKIPVHIVDTLKFKLDDIAYIYRNIKDHVEDKNPGIIQHDQIEYSKKIGAGAYAVVMQGKLKTSNETLAIKELKNVNFTPRSVLSLKRELDALLKLDHPNVLKFVGVTVTPPFCILTKFIGNGSLFETIHSENKDKLTNLVKIKIATGMARGLEYLAKKRFIHRDFKSQNVLLDDDYNAIICDFGISRIIGINMTCELGTIQWTAPEVLVQNSTTYGFSADTYSFGMVLWELLTCEIPYQGLRTPQIAYKVYEEGMKPPISNDAPESLATLINKCLDRKPNNRPSMMKIREMLENGEISFGETNMDEFKKWVKETNPKHMEVMNKVDELSLQKKNDILEKVYSINPLDPNGITILQQLFQIDYPLTKELFLNLISLMKQNYSAGLQKISFDLFKQVLIKQELLDVLQMDFVIEKLIELLQTHPNFCITSIKIISDRITDVDKVINHFLSLPQSYGTNGCIQAIINENKDKLPPSYSIDVFKKLSGTYSIGFFIFMINTYGIIPEFEEISCTSLILMKIFIKKLSKMTEININKVKEILDIKEFMSESKFSIRRTLDNVANAITSDSSSITEKMGILIYKYLIKNCLKYQQIKSIVPLLYILSKFDSMKQIISNDFFYDIIIKSFTTKDKIFGYRLIRLLPIFKNREMLIKVWKILINLYKENKEKELAITISHLIEREPKIDHSNLDNVIIESITEDEESCSTAVEILLSYDSEALKIFDNVTFKSNLINLIWKKNVKISKSIGKLCNHFIVTSPNILNYTDFYAEILNYLYDPDTPFNVAKHFIKFLGDAITNDPNVVCFLKEHLFYDYIEQLPWRYNDAETFSVIEAFKGKLLSIIPP